MAVVAKGYVVRNGRILMYGTGCRCRHNQDDSTSRYGGGEQITRLSLRIDGWTSISASSTAGAFGRFTTKAFILSWNHSRLFLNADISDGGEIAVGLSECIGTTCTPVNGYLQQQCVVQAGNTIYSRPTEWSGNDSDLSGFRGRTIQLSFQMKQPAQLYGLRFKSDDLVTAHAHTGDDRRMLVAIFGMGRPWSLRAASNASRYYYPKVPAVLEWIFMDLYPDRFSLGGAKDFVRWTLFVYQLVFDKPFGAPTGLATVLDAVHRVFTRSFAHLNVWLNVSAWKAELHWANEKNDNVDHLRTPTPNFACNAKCKTDDGGAQCYLNLHNSSNLGIQKATFDRLNKKFLYFGEKDLGTCQNTCPTPSAAPLPTARKGADNLRRTTKRG